MQPEPVDITVTLTPAQAEQLAGTLRLELAMRWEQARIGAVPCREEIERARALLEHYGDQLDRLDWGAPSGELRVRWRSDVLSELVDDLQEGAECCDDAASDGRARQLRETARTLAAALRRGASFGQMPVTG